MKKRVVILAGGVGGARLARGFEPLSSVETTVVVNVGDDDTIHGLRISPDLDTVVYTLANLEGPEGWGRSNETWGVNEELARYGLDNSFRLGDRDLALNIYRTMRISEGASLSEITREISKSLGLASRVLPASNDRIRTMVDADGWMDFQTYFVRRGHRDRVTQVRFDGIGDATPGPGVIDAIANADAIVVAPSNPILSIAPILEVPGIRPAVESIPTRIGVSPLIGGAAVKGPAAALLESLGHPPGNQGVVSAYQGLLTELAIHHSDSGEALVGPRVRPTDIMITDRQGSRRLAEEIISWIL